MVDIYYPYVESEAKWHELKYSLRSIEKHFLFDFKVWITGDLPEWITNVNHIPHNRCVGMQENTTYDAIAKLLAFCNHPHSGPGFIRMYDDVYVLREVFLDEIKLIKVFQTWEEIDQDNYEIWYRQLIRTLELVKKHGYRGFSTESHFPEFFETGKMASIIRFYYALENRLLTSSLYYNTVFSDLEPGVDAADVGIRFYFNRDSKYYHSSEGDLHFKCQGMYYLNHNDSGLTDNLKRFLEESFPNKSRFEK